MIRIEIEQVFKQNMLNDILNCSDRLTGLELKKH